MKKVLVLLGLIVGFCNAKEQYMRCFFIATSFFIGSIQTTSAQVCKEWDDSLEMYITSGRYTRSLILAEKRSECALREFGQMDSKYAIALSVEASLNHASGQYAEALALHGMALTIFEETVGKNDLDYVFELASIASVYADLGDYHSATELFHELLPIAERTFGKKSEDFGTFLNNSASLYENVGDYASAQVQYKESLKIIEENHSKNIVYYKVLNNLAGLSRELGDYSLTLDYLNETLSYTSNVLGENHPFHGYILNDLAVLHEYLGNTDEAIELYKKALINAKKALGRNHPVYGIRLVNIAGLYGKMGDYSSAILLFEQARVNSEESTGAKNQSYDYRLDQLADLYVRMGSFKNALAIYAEAIRNAENTIGKEHPLYGKYLNNLGVLYLEMDDYSRALPFFQKGLENCKETLGMNHPSYADRLNNMALLYSSMSKHNHALPLYLESNDLYIDQINRQFRFLTEQEKASYLEKLSSSFELIQSLSYITDTLYFSLKFRALDNELFLKGLILKYSRDVAERMVDQGDSKDSLLHHNWMVLKGQIAAQFSLPRNQRSASLSNWNTTADSMERVLVKRSSAFGKEQQKKEITGQQVQAQLQPNEVAIEFSHFDHYNKGWTDSILYVAYLIRKDSKHPEMVYLFEEKELNALAGEITPNALYHSRGIDMVNVSKPIGKGKTLYQLVWKNLEQHLEGIETIYFAPSGKLHQIAFAALPDSSGQLLSEKYQLVQLSSTGQLVVADPEPEKAPISMLGGIQYEYDTRQGSPSDSFIQVYNPVQMVANNQDSTNRSSRGTQWNYLKGTQKEARSLYRLYRRNRTAATFVSGAEATEEYIKSLNGNSPKVLHLATHGFFFEDPGNKHTDRTLMGQQPVYTLADDPLMRSGLILAGANYAWQHGQNPYEEEDGILTAYEIANLNLSNTDLVVLSACETGLGDIESSEGVYGLQRAFRMAGVEYIIMSLWQVPDNETSEFMQLFYKTWLGSDGGIYEAFTFTQRKMATKYRDAPQKWAGFVLVQ